MNLTVESTIRVAQKCPACKGERIVPSPIWAEFRAALKAGQTTEEKMEEWFRAKGEATQKTAMGRQYWALPPEEETCGECEGTGSVSGSITLKQLADFLGNLPK